MTRELTGRHVLIIFVALFGVVFAVNGLFAYLALDGFPGLEAKEPYRKGLAFNDQIARARTLAELGWTMEATPGPDGTLALRFRDRDGAPLAVSAVAAMLFHPASRSGDRTLALRPAGPGTFAAPLGSDMKGKRELRVTARGPDGRALAFRRVLWLN